MTNDKGELDKLYRSEDVQDIFSFYQNFTDPVQLIKWMKSRPPSPRTLFQQDGNHDITVVIPTRDHRSELAENCATNVFHGLQLLFVESGNTKDFNYAQNVNWGIKKALEFDPKWIVVSNDDVIKADPVSKLTKLIGEIEPNSVKTVFTLHPGAYHSVYHSICERNAFNLTLGPKVSEFERKVIALEKKFRVRWVHSPPTFPFRLFYRSIHEFLLTVSFSIFSSDFIRQVDGSLFDETYINGVEDIDLSYNLFKSKKNYSFIDYNLSEHVGASLGRNRARRLRDIANLTYLNQKIAQGVLNL